MARKKGGWGFLTHRIHLPRCGWNHFSFSYIFAQELNAGFADEAGTYGKDRLLVTAAVPVEKASIDAGYEIAAIAKYEAFYDQNIRLSYIFSNNKHSSVCLVICCLKSHF